MNPFNSLIPQQNNESQGSSDNPFAKLIPGQQEQKKQKSITDTKIGSLPGIKQANQIGIGIGSRIGTTGIGLGQTFLKGANTISNLMGNKKDQYNPLIENLENIKQKVFIEPNQKELDTTGGQIGKTTSDIATFMAPSSKVTGAQQKITGLIDKLPGLSKKAQFAKGALGVLGRAIPEAVGAGVTSLAVSGGDMEQAKKDALLGGGVSAGLGTAGSLYRGFKNSGAAKNLLSSTTGIPKTAFNEIESGINKNATPEKSLDDTRKAVYGLREKATQMWKERLPKIADEYNNVRHGLSDSQVSRLSKVVDEFGVDEKYIPQNLKNISALESLNLMKGLNELDSLAVKSSPKGAVVRTLRQELRDQIIKNFGGKDGEVSKLWNDYSIKSKILENVDSIVKAYKTNPISTVTAKNRLMAIFDENKPEFLKAIKEIEGELGINLTKDIASTKFKNILPSGILKADGGLPTRTGIVDKIIKGILLPFTSPKWAGNIASKSTKEAGFVGKRLFGNYSSKDIIKAQKPTQIQNNITPPKITPKTVSKIPISKTLPQLKKKSTLGKIKDILSDQRGSIQAFKNEGDLTTKILKDLEGKTTVSKQYILDATNRGELKQVERDLIRDILATEKGDTINVSDFAKKVKAELLPLKVLDSKSKAGYGTRGTRYENISLPDELKGSVKNYEERVYQSPIQTSAGQVHFGDSTKNYFGHTRIEDMADNKTRRVIEVQSDLYQKGNLEKEIPNYRNDSDYLSASERKEYSDLIARNIDTDNAVNRLDYTKERVANKKRIDELTKKAAQDRVKTQNEKRAELSKLQQYNDPTAHFRMIREEIKKAAQDGKTKLQFPTGETAMKIEGLGQGENRWFDVNYGTRVDSGSMKVGDEITHTNQLETNDVGSHWIITDILGDGKFKAVQKSGVYSDNTQFGRPDLTKKLPNGDTYSTMNEESFDISGKVDTNNPIYKFYEKEVQKYLNKYGGKRIVDDKGVSWIEIPINKEQGKAPVEAFGKIGMSPLFAGAGLSLLGAVGMGAYQSLEKKNTFKYQAEKTPEKEVKKEIPPEKLGESLMQLESSGGKNNKNQDGKEMRWLTGLTTGKNGAVTELKRLKLIDDSFDENSKEDVLDASIKYFKLMQRINPDLTPAEVYVDKYWTQWKKAKEWKPPQDPQTVREEKMNEFNRLISQ